MGKRRFKKAPLQLQVCPLTRRGGHLNAGYEEKKPSVMKLRHQDLHRKHTGATFTWSHLLIRTFLMAQQEVSDWGRVQLTTSSVSRP